MNFLSNQRGWRRVEIRTDSNYAINCICEYAHHWRSTADDDGNWINARGNTINQIPL